jgi:hypothetical protein
MPEPHSTAPAVSSKPAKPYPEFPLTAHPAGYWCKKIRGKLYYIFWPVDRSRRCLEEVSRPERCPPYGAQTPARFGSPDICWRCQVSGLLSGRRWRNKSEMI